MVNKSGLDLIFRALSDETRREVYQELSASAQSMRLKNLSSYKAVSPPLMQKHIQVLLRAGLVERHDAKGYHPTYSAIRSPLEDAHWWMAEIMHFWQDDSAEMKAENLKG